MKNFKLSKQTIFTLLGILVIAGSIPVAVLLVKQRQEIRKEAAVSMDCGHWCDSKGTGYTAPYCKCNSSTADSGYALIGCEKTTDCNTCCAFKKSSGSQTPSGQNCAEFCTSKVGHTDFPWCICNADRAVQSGYTEVARTTTSECKNSCVAYQQSSSGGTTGTGGSAITDDSGCTNMGGHCLYTSGGCGENNEGTFKPGYCTGPADRQCCVPAGNTGPKDDSGCTNQGGTCKSTSESCSGIFKPGFCTGSTSRQCCVPSTTTGTGTTGTGTTGTTGSGGSSYTGPSNPVWHLYNTNRICSAPSPTKTPTPTPTPPTIPTPTPTGIVTPTPTKTPTPTPTKTPTQTTPG